MQIRINHSHYLIYGLVGCYIAFCNLKGLLVNNRIDSIYNF